MLKTSKWLLFSLAFVPLIMDYNVFFPFVEGKTIFLRTIIFLVSIFLAVAVFQNKKNQEQTSSRLKYLIKNPLFISISSFLLITLVGVFFAPSSFRAFLGDMERGEGFIGLFFFYLIFFFTSLIFTKKDFLTFFKFSFITGAILFIKALVELSGGNTRPGSYTGNPIYLATYFLFLIFACFYVFKNNWNKRGFWWWSSIPVFIFSSIGILITQSRGVLLGILTALVACFVYLLVKYRDKSILGISYKKISLIILGLFIIFSTVFISTKSNSFWQKIPGLSRISQFTFADPTLKTRLISLGVSLQSISPANEGLERILVGWGQENFSVAYNKYYNPDYFLYETAWFDRAHNKLMDVLVMSGGFGFIAYLFIWFFAFRYILKKESIAEKAMLIFFGIAYFIQNLFVFDSVVTYPLFFIFLSLSILEEDSAPHSDSNERSQSKKISADPIYIMVLFSLLSLLLSVFYIVFSLVPYFQARNYIALKKEKISLIDFQTRVKDYLSPYTYAQDLIRTDFITTAINQIEGGQVNAEFVQEVVGAGEDFTKQEPYNPRNFMRLGGLYEVIAVKAKSLDFIKKAEVVYKKALDLSSNRQDLLYLTGYNVFFHQQKTAEGLAIFKKALDLSPEVPESNYYYGVALSSLTGADFKMSMPYMEKALESPRMLAKIDTIDISIYKAFLNKFVQIRDKKNALTAVNRLISIDKENSQNWSSIKSLIEKDNWYQIVIK